MLHQKPCPPPGKVLKAGSCAEFYKALPASAMWSCVVMLNFISGFIGTGKVIYWGDAV